ncbi:MAG TPA: cytochrome C [Xanthobacteraceae bacterium]
MAAGTKPLGATGWVPPISAMTIFGFTHTATPMDNAGSPLNRNDNVELQQASLFYGGALTEHVGAFVQATYAGPQFGQPAASQFTWDNLDVRYAEKKSFGGMSVVYGVSVNNGPTVQDPWNTTPAFGYPFLASNLANTPAAKTLLDNAFAAHVLGATAYVFINDMLYLEGGGYGTLNANLQSALGVVALNGPQTTGGIPYFRVAFAPTWGKHSWEIGAFGLSANVAPAPFLTPSFNQFRDVGVDSQYQYMGDGYVVTLRGTYLHEIQVLNASFANGLSANQTDTLNTFRAQAELALGGTVNKWILTGGYFNTWGSSDTLLYAGNSTFSPNSDGFTAEVAFMPFGKTNPPAIWPWFNTKIGLQYVWYNKFNGASLNFDGAGTNARDNNTLYAYVWAAF